MVICSMGVTMSSESLDGDTFLLSGSAGISGVYACTVCYADRVLLSN